MNEEQIIDKINSLFPEGITNRHSFFQLQYFVIGKEPTLQAKIRACKKEILNRKSEIESLLLATEDLKDQIELIELKEDSNLPKTKESEINKKRNLRVKENLNKKLEELYKSLESKHDETSFLIGLYEKLVQIEPEKDWDSLEVQKEYWNARLTAEIEANLMLGKVPSVEDFKTVISLPNDMPIKVNTLKLIGDRDRYIKGAITKKEITKEDK